MTQHYAMLQRNLLYTGVTRGKQLVVLVGQKKAVAIAVRNVSGRRRWSKLDEWLRPGSRLHGRSAWWVEDPQVKLLLRRPTGYEHSLTNYILLAS